ncbi:Hsp20/alpha crystallin family protein [Caldimonas sp. KR1-144]|uniref:Hsp20/alpha crystallin family protein n=1 Tax=Caldimonas sp. KR1-144 TaxID=3400911 RepID=UPI003C0A841F
MAQRQSPSAGQQPAQQQRGGGLATRGSYGLGWPQGGPFALLHQLDEDMNRLFNEFMGGRAWGSEGAAAWMPQIEMHEREGRLHVCADLPGMSKDDIKVDLSDGQLTIQGERRQASSSGEERGHGYYRSERSYGSFYRSIPLPEGVDVDSARASFRDGVLDVSFDAPSPKGRGRQLTIEDESSSPAQGGPTGGAGGASR